MIKFRCGHCGQKLGVPEKYAGRRVRCSKCENPARVPQIKESDKSAEAVVAGSPVKTAPPEETEPDIFSEFQQAGAEEIDPQLEEALAAARQQRVADRVRSTNQGRKSRSSNSEPIEVRRSAGSQRRTIPELVPDILQLPVSVIFGILAAGVMIGVWVIASKACGNPLCFMAMLTPVAVGVGFRFLLTDRNILHGLLCILIGLGSILGGKAAVAKLMVIPHYKKLASEEILLDIPKALSDEKHQFDKSSSAKNLAINPSYMICASLISMVEDGSIDPAKGRMWAFEIAEKGDLGKSMYDSISENPSEAMLAQLNFLFPDLSEIPEDILSQANIKLVEWQLNNKHLRMAKKYFPAISRISEQANMLTIFNDPEKSFKYAMIGTIGFFDLVWILLGMSLGYLTLVYD